MAPTPTAVDEISLPDAPRTTAPPGTLFHFVGLSHGERSAKPLDPLPDYGIAYFHQLLSQYQTFPVGSDDPLACRHPNAEAEMALSALAAKAEHGPLTWQDVDRLETALLRVLPEAVLRSHAWSLRAHYCEIAGTAMTGLYEKSKPTGWDDAVVPAETLRADLAVLLGEMQKYRTFLPARDRVRDRISRKTACWTLGITFLGALLWVAAQMAAQRKLIPSATAPALTMMLAMMSGGVGGFVSMQSRLQTSSSQSLPLLDRIELETEQFSLYLSPVSGAIFAAILYFLFLGHYLQGTLFPEVSEVGLSNPVNFGGLVVWTFLAGFAERLVPDVLSRIVSRSGAMMDKTPPKG